MKDNLIVLDGMRAYRLRYRITDCPNFNDQEDVEAWKEGYRSASNGASEKEAVAKYVKKLNIAIENLTGQKTTA